MKFLNICTTTLAMSSIALAGMLSISAYAAPQAKDTTWVLTQVSDKLGGIVVYLHNDAVKVDKMGSYSAICKGPSWNVVLYNSTRHIMSERTFADWLSRGVYRGLEFIHPPNDFSKDGCSYVLENHTFKFKNVEVRRGAILKNGRKNSGYKASLIVAPAIKADVHVFRFLRTFTDIDLPLEFATILYERNDKGGQQFMQSNAGLGARGIVHDIQTSDIRQIPYLAKDFTCPANFKRVPDSEIVMGPKNELIEDFLPPK